MNFSENVLNKNIFFNLNFKNYFRNQKKTLRNLEFFWVLGLGGHSFPLMFCPRDRSSHQGACFVTPDF